jgi:hypothetical protein
MKLTDAEKLHNEDEVVSKKTEESIRVIRTVLVPKDSLIMITGIGDQSGYAEWTHKEVK